MIRWVSRVVVHYSALRNRGMNVTRFLCRHPYTPVWRSTARRTNVLARGASRRHWTNGSRSRGIKSTPLFLVDACHGTYASGSLRTTGSRHDCGMFRQWLYFLCTACGVPCRALLLCQDSSFMPRFRGDATEVRLKTKVLLLP